MNISYEQYLLLVLKIMTFLHLTAEGNWIKLALALTIKYLQRNSKTIVNTKQINKVQKYTHGKRQEEYYIVKLEKLSPCEDIPTLAGVLWSLSQPPLAVEAGWCPRGIAGRSGRWVTPCASSNLSTLVEAI